MAEDYDTSVVMARQAAARAWEHQVAYDAALRERDRHIAFAWNLRPGGHTWDRIVDEVCRGLPERARFGVNTARRAEYAFRDEAMRVLPALEDEADEVVG